MADDGKDPSSSDAKAPEKPFVVSAPQISLPKGGGAIRGIGEILRQPGHGDGLPLRANRAQPRAVRFVYDFDRAPVCAAVIARETHVSALAPGQQTEVQMHFVYSDGFGRKAQAKAPAEPGPQS